MRMRGLAVLSRCTSLPAAVLEPKPWSPRAQEKQYLRSCYDALHAAGHTVGTSPEPSFLQVTQ